MPRHEGEDDVFQAPNISSARAAISKAITSNREVVRQGCPCFVTENGGTVTVS